MRFKIENNYLNIVNYPSIEKHFEEMASQGWLISKVIFENIFIYKKIEPKELDFSISIYEVEKGFNKRTKLEFKEFQSVCKSVGWNYVAKSRDLHICFKEKDSEAIDLETDDEETFGKIEKIAKRQLIGSYTSIVSLVLFSGIILFGLFTYTNLIQNGLIQVVIPLIPIFILLSISQIITIKRFLKTNRKNIEIGNKIEHSESKFYFEKIMFLSSLIVLFTLIIYTLYIGIKLKNFIVLLVMMYTFISLTLFSIIGMVFRVIVKPTGKNWISQIIVFIIIIGLSFTLNKIYLLNFESIVNKYTDLNVEEYKVLTPDKPVNKDEYEEARIFQNASLFVPLSYEYGYYDSNRREYVTTKYSDALNEYMANTLVKMYIRQAKHQLKRYEWNLEYSIGWDNYYAYEEDHRDIHEEFPKEKSLEELGLSLEEFNKMDKNIMKRAVKTGMEIIRSKAISEDKENLWNLEEVYYLNYDKTAVVIRDGKEVFYLEGKDFSDPEIIKIVKDKLEL